MNALTTTVRDLVRAHQAGARPLSHAGHDQHTPGCLACALTQLAASQQVALAAEQTGARAKAPTSERTPGP